MPKFLDQSPSPKSHIKTLMRIGYTLDSAVADIIDNSISARAKNINIIALPSSVDPILSIVDDGFGMDLDELVSNMRIGCKDPDIDRESGDLGRFGSGMKTASFSQARQLTVITKKAGYPLVAARWDIDKIEETDSWCLEVFEEGEIDAIDGNASDFFNGSGTQVIWGKLTFLEVGSHTKSNDGELANRLAQLKKYIGLHFHRFMRGSDATVFRLNNSKIESIEPFMVGVSGYQEGPSERLRCKGGYIEIQTHVLPHIKNIDRKRLEQAGGAEGIAQQQGIYIYRDRRLISYGSWLGMARNSQLSALARVQVDIPSALDNEWSTDVKKSSIQIPPRVKRSLKKFLSDPVRRSKRTYRYRGAIESANNFWKVCEDENEKTITYQIDTENEMLNQIFDNHPQKKRGQLIEYLRNLAVSLPVNHIYEKMCERPRDVRQNEISIEQFDEIMKNFLGTEK